MNRSRPKVCFVLPEFDRHTHFMYVAEMIEALALDHDIFLVVEKGSVPASNLKKIYKQKFKFGPLRALENFFILLFARFCAYRHIYVHYSFVAGFNAGLITQIFGGRSYYWNAGLPWQYRRGFWRRTGERVTYKIVTFLVTGAEALRHHYAKYYGISPAKIKIIPNWIDVKAFRALPASFRPADLKSKLSIPADKKIVLFVHRLARRKGAHYLPDIAEAVRNEGGVLVIAGDGPERGTIEATIKEKNLDDVTRMIGWVEQSEVKKYLAIADVFIMPSEEEGFPHVILEAMAASVPFVAFDVGGMSDIVDKKYLIAANTIGLFTERLQEFLAKPEMLAAFRKLEEQTVMKFDKPVVLEQFKSLFDERS